MEDIKVVSDLNICINIPRLGLVFEVDAKHRNNFEQPHLRKNLKKKENSKSNNVSIFIYTYYKRRIYMKG